MRNGPVAKVTGLFYVTSPYSIVGITQMIVPCACPDEPQAELGDAPFIFLFAIQQIHFNI